MDTFKDFETRHGTGKHQVHIEPSISWIKLDMEKPSISWMNQHGMFRLDSVGYGDMDGDMDRGMGIINPLKSWDLYCIPSGKHTTNYGKLPFLMGKSTISMAIFNSYVSHYQRVPMMFGFPNSHCVLDDHESQKLSF